MGYRSISFIDDGQFQKVVATAKRSMGGFFAASIIPRIIDLLMPQMLYLLCLLIICCYRSSMNINHGNRDRSSLQLLYRKDMLPNAITRQPFRKSKSDCMNNHNIRIYLHLKPSIV
jgi:hypothetical protein